MQWKAFLHVTCISYYAEPNFHLLLKNLSVLLKHYQKKRLGF